MTINTNAQALVALARGVKKNISPEESERRSKRMQQVARNYNSARQSQLELFNNPATHTPSPCVYGNINHNYACYCHCSGVDGSQCTIWTSNLVRVWDTLNCKYFKPREGTR